MKSNRIRQRRPRGSSKRRPASSSARTKKTSKGKKWVTAIAAAQRTLRTTGSFEAARRSLRKQAITNARRLFGSVGSI